MRNEFAQSVLFASVNDMLNNEHTLRLIQLQLAVLKDIGTKLVKATYELEGNKHMALEAQLHLNMMRTFLQSATPMTLPTVAALLVEFNARAPQVDWRALAPPMWQEVTQYINSHFFGNADQENSVGKMCYAYQHFYPFAALFNPRYLREVTPAMVQALRGKLPFVTDADIDGLVAELSEYNHLRGLNPCPADDIKRKSRGHTVMLKSGICAWWKHMNDDFSDDIPTWIKLFKLVIILQPSSAEVERVFSLLKRVFDGPRNRILLDYMELAVMLRRNKTQPHHDADWLPDLADLVG